MNLNILNCSPNDLTLLKQVVNGFFWAGKPVVSQVKESTRSTALGVSTATRLQYSQILFNA